MSERHGWLRKALADRGLAAADAARAWKCHDAVLVRFIKTGEPKITASRVAALVALLDIPRPEILARLGERPLDTRELRDLPISVVAGFAQTLGWDIKDVLERLEKPKRRKTDNVGANVVTIREDDEYGGW